MILTKPDQYTTCVLNKHMTKPCLHYKELWVLTCYWCHNWHSNFGYNLRIPSWSIVNKLILIIFFLNSNWSSARLAHISTTEFQKWIYYLSYINTPKNVFENMAARAYWNKTRKLVSTSIYYNNLTICQEFYINKTKHTNIYIKCI